MNKRDFMKMAGVAVGFPAIIPAGASAVGSGQGDRAIRSRADETPVPSRNTSMGTGGKALRETFDMNSGWRFLQEDVEERNFESIHRSYFSGPEWIKAGNNGLAKVGYNDQAWQVVDLPHDFLQENAFSAAAEVSHGSMETGVAWYRKMFELPAADNGRCIQLEFDGIFRDSSIWVNGHFIRDHLSGYTSVCCDISAVLNYGGLNTVAVRCDARLPELWSYEGGGIYRDVRLVKSDPVRVDWCGTFVQAHVRSTRAELDIETRVSNGHFSPISGEIHSIIIDPTGAEKRRVHRSFLLEAAQQTTLDQTAVLDTFERWSIEQPSLYILKTQLFVAGRLVDEYETPFGIRTIRFDGEKGFFLNDQPMKLKGVCNHQDHAGVGTAIPDSLQEWRMLQMKKMGVNALRVAHNPPTPALLDICDRLGVLVMDETRLTGTSPEVLQQLEDMIRRDRNHPSVIMWSLGNEEMNVQANEVGVKLLRHMQHVAHTLDPSRLTTCSVNCNWLEIAKTHDALGFRVDVFGNNYVYTKYGVDGALYDQFHEQFPDWPLIGGETGGSFATRGLYDTEYYEGKPIQLNDFGWGGICWEGDHLKGVASAYNNGLTPWGSTIDDTWRHCAERDYMAGTFLWTGFDYRGETYPYRWPAVVTRFGLMDLCGFPKDAYFYYKAWWNPEPMLHLFPHWNWAGKEGQAIQVRAYTNCAAVELCLNGKTVTRKAVAVNGYFEAMVGYEPGRLEAVGYDAAGKEISRTVRETVGLPAAIRLTADRIALRADARDTAVCRVEILDAAGRLVPTADESIEFSLQGPGQIIGVGNGDPTSHESPKGSAIKTFCGLAQVLVQTTNKQGGIYLAAEAKGLLSDRMTLHSAGSALLPVIPGILESVAALKTDANPVDGIL